MNDFFNLEKLVMSTALVASSLFVLTAAQQTQIDAITKNASGDRLEKHQAIIAVVTPEQRTQFETLKSERANKSALI